MPVPPRVWLDENYDRIIRDNKEFQEKMNYIINNPAKANLIETEKNYKFFEGLEACATRFHILFL